MGDKLPLSLPGPRCGDMLALSGLPSRCGDMLALAGLPWRLCGDMLPLGLRLRGDTLALRLPSRS